MIIRQTRMEELEEVMGIYERAARYMAETGNPNQWTPGYPSRDMIAADIGSGVSYVMEDNGGIEAVFAYIEGADPTYGRIENGAWRSSGTYATMHRLASAGRQRGIAGQCFAWCAQQASAHGCGSLRADTHMDNKIMQHALAQNGFVYCGVIHLANGAPRLAYERILAGGYMGDLGHAQKGDGIAFGVTSMVLGIVSLLLFCTCINFVTAIAAIIFGIVQIAGNKEKSFAIAGIVTAAISIVLGLFLWGMVATGMAEMGVNSYEEFYDSYYGDYYDYDDDYYDYDGDTYYEDDYDDYYDDSYDYYDNDYYDYYDYYDDYYYEEEGGAEFLQADGLHILY